MPATIDVLIRRLGASAAVACCALSVACEPQPTAPASTATLPRPSVVLISRSRVIEPGDRRNSNLTGIDALSRAGVADPVNATFDARTNRVWSLESSTWQLIEMPTGADGSVDHARVKRFDARSFGVRTPQGLTVDPASGRLFILDAGPRIVRVDPHPHLSFHRPTISVIDLAPTGLTRVRGIAFDPTNGHFHVLEPLARALHEISEAGRIVTTRDVSEFRFDDVRGMTVGPTGDATDDPSAQGVYVAGATTTTELSLGATVTAAATATTTATLVRTTQTSGYSPPSPDPSGIAYAGHLGSLMIVDGEVEEMTIYAGVNVWETTPSGSPTRTWTTTSFSVEPVGAAYNPANRHLFISDDDQRRVFEIDPGADGQYSTSDDRMTSFDTRPYGNDDPEGLAYDIAQGVLFIADGVNAQVYRVAPGVNGVFDGVAPAGDDEVTNFDTQVHGLIDPEGIAYDSDLGHLYVGGRDGAQVFEFSTTGALLGVIDVSAANADKVSGLEYIPATASAGRRLYIVDRRVDNDSDPNENDGRLYEFSLPPIGGNTVPSVTITSPANFSTFTQGSAITFTGTATDTEDGNLSAALAWSSSRDGALGSGGSVSSSTLSVGTHAITAAVTDAGGAQASASITVTVVVPSSVTEVRVAASADDAEESATGSMSMSSSDLDMVFAGTANQLVGMRFNGVAIPPGATITGASVQFQVDEATSDVTSLTISGQAADNPATFSSGAKISTRPRTVSAVAWSPVPWTIVGQAGVNQRTPSIASVIQEIVNRPGWRSGNSVVVIITGTGRRIAEAFNGVPAAAPLLRVEFSVGPNVEPTATNVAISGTPEVGRVLTGTYTYADANGDAEGTSTYRWLRDGAPITGATARSYTLVTADAGTLIAFEVTPVAVSGASPGTSAQSPAVGPVTVPPPNSPPTATNVTISGTAQVSQVLTGTYTYGDANGDAEGTSTYRWLRDGAPITGATARSYTLVTADAGTLIVFEVTPVAASGASPGTSVQSPAVGPVTVPPPNSPPTATNVTISGTVQVSRVLTGNYVYSDADGDAQGTSTYRWLRDGAPIIGATARSYTLVAADEGTLIAFEVTPVAASGASPGTSVQSATVGPVAALPPNTAPIATNVTISGPASFGHVLTGNYNYSDADGDAEGTSTYRWFRDGGPISGATTRKYTLVSGDVGSLIGFEVTPVAASGPSPGASVQSPTVGPVTPAGTVIAFQMRVMASADDAEESSTGSMSMTSSDLDMVFAGTVNQLIGMRFNGVTIPAGSTISAAYVQFQVDEASSDLTSLTISGQAADNAVTFSSAAKISTRPRTASTVAWSPAPWTVVNQAGANQQTPSLASVIQEIVSRPGWQNGNSLALIITGTGRRVAEAFNGVPAAAPLLRVEYTFGSPTP